MCKVSSQKKKTTVDQINYSLCLCKQVQKRDNESVEGSQSNKNKLCSQACIQSHGNVGWIGFTPASTWSEISTSIGSE